MVQLFICQWCGYVEEKELPEEREEGIVTCACCNTPEVDSVFAHGDGCFAHGVAVLSSCLRILSENKKNCVDEYIGIS
ncbi:hypothetical protein AV540_19855 [Brevibacillus parabrevis]|uniref:hypothetical protein n=1 Tax=Brevibacillus parabrevis TaxID=54914 RepID=UPI0007ABE8A5|nr:hypothetical protein [Brevibacillus parabrevis]KZE47356.1 hypothetical protein AV540_19855 [Brevibacillus parabrevis]